MAAGLPRPEPSPAGKLDEEMKRKRNSASFLASLVLVGAFAVTTQDMAPPVALGRTAPVTTVSGDPDDPEAPTPGPKKSAQSTTTQVSRPYQGPGVAQPLWSQIWRSILVQMFRLGRL